MSRDLRDEKVAALGEGLPRQRQGPGGGSTPSKRKGNSEEASGWSREKREEKRAGEVMGSGGA